MAKQSTTIEEKIHAILNDLAENGGIDMSDNIERAISQICEVVGFEKDNLGERLPVYLNLRTDSFEVPGTLTNVDNASDLNENDFEIDISVKYKGKTIKVNIENIEIENY